MRKADEIALLDKLIQQTPRNSYLRSMLDHCRIQFENDIRSDFSTLPNFAEIERDGLALRERNKELHKLNEKVAQEIRDKRHQQARVHNLLREIQLKADDLGRSAKSMADQIEKDATA